ncbi:MAG: hypothetical protein ACRDT4_19410, partial [Micromonosporaceae bacterium]
MIAGLVVVASIATGLVVSHGARQLDVQPGRGTTPYLAVDPSGPVRAPSRPARQPESEQPPAEAAP